MAAAVPGVTSILVHGEETVLLRSEEILSRILQQTFPYILLTGVRSCAYS